MSGTQLHLIPAFLPPLFCLVLDLFAWDRFDDGLQKPWAYTHHHFEIWEAPSKTLFFRPHMYCNYLVFDLVGVHRGQAFLLSFLFGFD